MLLLSATCSQAGMISGSLRQPLGVLESIQVEAKVKDNPLKSVSRSQSSNVLFYHEI